jgi:1,2-dihydroxy-3-keto-5-methylthiopentene dioxygenase
MTRLRLFDDADPSAPRSDTIDGDEIAARLGRIGVRFRRWPAERTLAPSSSDSEILAAYRGEVDRLLHERGDTTIDVVRMRHDHPQRDALRTQFLREHRHVDDEVRFFVEGRGLFCLHVGAVVALVTCERGDLIAVPCGVPHWFDMGARPEFTVIRVFANPAGWVPEWTGSNIADVFPRLESPQ